MQQVSQITILVFLSPHVHLPLRYFSFHVITFHLVHGLSVSLPLSLEYPPSSHQAITITLHFQTSSKDTLLPVSLSCHLASIHQRALILFIQTLALYKSFTYLLTYLLTYFCISGNASKKQVISMDKK